MWTESSIIAKEITEIRSEVVDLTNIHKGFLKNHNFLPFTTSWIPKSNARTRILFLSRSPHPAAWKNVLQWRGKCFHRSWVGAEKSVIQISWFLDLFWRWEVKVRFKKIWRISLRFHSVIRQHFFKLEYAQLVSLSCQSRPRGSLAFPLPSRTIDKS